MTRAINFKDIIDVIKFAYERYDEKDFSHCLRVASYTAETMRSFTEEAFAYIAAAILHDILEDTETTERELRQHLPFSVLSEGVISSIKILTKDPDTSYEDYIKRIFDSNDPIAITVKRADMKDHLTQTETLSDKLKAKYFSVMHYFI